ncbi:DUF4241 domain-containing protein [Flectobacillus sp. BAB-3569]|uniref:DUF4241 domain-containing protein n=1 Tax=Flectobacillus sp. BAB-3569 TaxID=1509483 RepID=UPI000BA42AC5|nr:DUF4241 domain-containing protein [Flectobacillus sp. BAB-3569]PAC27194.1 hypothetical protein BWI92_23295 [Flectobacillus sp. BAB-3569]
MGLLDKFFGRTEHDVQNKKVKQTIFDEEIEFDYSDFENLKTNKNYDRFFAGNLKLTSGQIISADPVFRELGLPQSWTVKPDEYPVYLYIGIDDGYEGYSGRVAYAELNFKDEIPVSWELSLISETLLADDFEKKMNGMFPVENGLGCFADYETWKLYNQEIADFDTKNKEGNFYRDVLESHFKENANIPASSRGEDWINYTPSNANANIIMFGSGWGDGLYSRYVGLDKNGQPIKLIIDFIQLTDEEDEEE